MLAALADGETVIEGWVPAEVWLATLRCMQALGAEVEETGSALRVKGKGWLASRNQQTCCTAPFGYDHPPTSRDSSRLQPFTVPTSARSRRAAGRWAAPRSRCA